MLDRDIYARRRAALMDAIGPRACALFHAPPEVLRSGDSHYKYRQSSDLLYLTGFEEPEATLVLRPGAEREKVVLFVRPRDPEREVWDGRRAGVDGAVARYGADVAFPAGELSERLPALLAGCDDLYYSLGVDAGFDAMVAANIARLRMYERRVGSPPRRVVDPREVLHEMRLRKSGEEIAVLRRAAAITAEAHQAAMRAARPGATEYELEAVIDYTFRRRGGIGPGYPTIVGSGANATILHYVENRRAFAAGDLVLVDAGCEVDYYTADVTRTFPVGGKFSPAQRRVYEIVLAAQLAGIQLSRAGATIEGIHERCVEVLAAGMVDLGLLAGPVSERIGDASYKRFYMHRTSHWLGMDVHDVGAYLRDGKPRPLEPGMVITIEPGLYIAEDAQGVPDAYRGIGVRIEDDVLITAGDPEVLTAGCPKQADEVEAIAATA